MLARPRYRRGCGRRSSLSRAAWRSRHPDGFPRGDARLCESRCAESRSPRQDCAAGKRCEPCREPVPRRTLPMGFFTTISWSAWMILRRLAQRLAVDARLLRTLHFGARAGRRTMEGCNSRRRPRGAERSLTAEWRREKLSRRPEFQALACLRPISGSLKFGAGARI
jgi:hypothetical protein